MVTTVLLPRVAPRASHAGVGQQQALVRFLGLEAPYTAGTRPSHAHPHHPSVCCAATLRTLWTARSWSCSPTHSTTARYSERYSGQKSMQYSCSTASSTAAVQLQGQGSRAPGSVGHVCLHSGSCSPELSRWQGLLNPACPPARPVGQQGTGVCGACVPAFRELQPKTVSLARPDQPCPPALLSNTAALSSCLQRARELLGEGDQGSGGSGIKILLAALSAAPGLQTLLADAVVHRWVAAWVGLLAGLPEGRLGGLGGLGASMGYLRCSLVLPAVLLLPSALTPALPPAFFPCFLPPRAASWPAGPSSAPCSSAWKPQC